MDLGVTQRLPYIGTSIVLHRAPYPFLPEVYSFVYWNLNGEDALRVGEVKEIFNLINNKRSERQHKRQLNTGVKKHSTTNKLFRKYLGNDEERL